MKNHSRNQGLLAILILCTVILACKSDPFIGTWKPAPNTDKDIKIDSFIIEKDGTFTMKPKDSSRKEMKGTYTKSGDKLELKGPDLKQSVEATIESDGRMRISEGGRDPVYFVKS
jgi:hypothetical protein